MQIAMLGVACVVIFQVGIAVSALAMGLGFIASAQQKEKETPPKKSSETKKK